jgi:GT2 family glycosyltransferase
MVSVSTTIQPRISVVIVSWNVKKLLQANLERLASIPKKYPIEVFVVDNGSHDGTAFMVRNEFPWVRLITNDWDAGFAGPNNQALRLATGEVVILLNPDMLVEEGALETAYEKLMADKTIGVLSIKLLNHITGQPINGVRRRPDIWSQVCIILKLQHLFPNIIKYYLWTDFDYSRSQEVDQVRGSFFALRRELLEKVGYLDAGYHIWFEEVDYCNQVKKAGYRVFYCAEATAHDFVGKGVSQMKRLETQRIFTASMLRYFRKWHPGWRAWLIMLLRPIGLLGALCADIFLAAKKRFVL